EVEGVGMGVEEMVEGGGERGADEGEAEEHSDGSSEGEHQRRPADDGLSGRDWGSLERHISGDNRNKWWWGGIRGSARGAGRSPGCGQRYALSRTRGLWTSVGRRARASSTRPRHDQRRAW